MITRRDLLKKTGLLAGGLMLGNLPQLTLAQTESKTPLFLAHYMPWYQGPEVSGFWGWHWTMDHFDPAKNEIASHFMPLTGPYDSSDEQILEYQVALMKLSGIDGVIVDWYGIEDFRDYAAVNRSTLKLFEYIQKAGMTFCICYEDQSLKHMINEGLLPAEEAHERAQAVMQFMHENWFQTPNYLKFQDQPVLLIFGPQYFKSSRDWEQIFSVLDPQPLLVTLDKHLVTNALGSFPWPPMQGYTINQDVLDTLFTQFYRKAQRWDYLVGGAFPGFYDIYQEAGVRSSYGFMDDQGGETFRYTLQLAIEQNSDVIQLITWNDYGEGTIIEPTEEFAYQYLEMMQETKRSLQADFSFSAADLELPLKLYNLRKTNPSPEVDEAFAAILNGDLEKANILLD